MLHDKSDNQHSVAGVPGRPTPDLGNPWFEDRKVRTMGGGTTTQIEMTGTVMTTPDTWDFINYDPATPVLALPPAPDMERNPGPDYRTGTVKMADYLAWLNGHGYGINLTVE